MLLPTNGSIGVTYNMNTLEKMQDDIDQGLPSLRKLMDEIDTDLPKKINSFFGYKVLNNVRLETFNSLKENITKKKIHVSKNSAKKFKDSLKSLNNEKIKKSLSDLINSIQK